VPGLPEPSTEARSRALVTISPPASRTNVVPDEAPPSRPLQQSRRGVVTAVSRLAPVAEYRGLARR
jgi:hypothetical protein